jgi:hypothetical protein
VGFFLAVFIAFSLNSERPTQALCRAARVGEVRALRALVAAGADVNGADGAGTTPVMAAAAAGQTAALAVLADAGADLDVRDRLGRTALDLALAAGNVDAARLLRLRGARGSGKSPGDTVCVERWAQRGFCGSIERVEPGRFRLRVTRVIGCEKGCEADQACSGGLEVDPSSVGALLWVSRSCLTRTFPGSGAER